MTELASGFQRFGEADWRKVAGDLPVSRTDDGIAVGPIYAPKVGTDTLWNRGGRPWDIVATVAAAAVSESAAQIRAEVEGGATGIELRFATSPSARGRGLPSDLDWPALFGDTALASLALRIDAGEVSFALARSLSKFLGRQPPRRIDLAFDPIATLAGKGSLSASLREIGRNAVATVTALKETCPNVSVLTADGRLWHNAGASEATELAATLAAVAEYLRLLEANGVAADDAVRTIGLTLAADADEFVTIAKLRAMRLLHARLAEAAEIAPVACRIHVETSWRMISRLDPHTNILRTTAAVAAAGIGGADSIAALPFDAALASTDALARRIARNSQTILIEEAGLAHVADPGAGAGAVETLTEALAAEAWERFRGIEAAGGLLAAVSAGTIQRSVAESRERRLDRVRSGEVKLVGANAFRLTNDPAPIKTGDTNTTSTVPAAESALTAEALTFTRLSEPVES